MVGLDGAGKTTILYKLQLGEVQATVPTIGFNVETVKYRNINFIVWDIGGQSAIRLLWNRYFSGVDGVIFVVDSSDSRIKEARDELHKMLAEPDLRDAVLLVYNNKKDLPGARSLTETASQLDLPSCSNRKWHIEGACALTADGLYEGLEWLASQLS